MPDLIDQPDWLGRLADAEETLRAAGHVTHDEASEIALFCDACTLAQDRLEAEHSIEEADRMLAHALGEDVHVCSGPINDDGFIIGRRLEADGDGCVQLGEIADLAELQGWIEGHRKLAA